MIGRRLMAVAALAVTVGCASMPRQGILDSTETELEIRPGAFPAFQGTAFDEAVEFTNDIYGAKCYPLYEVTGWSETAAGRRSTGSILLWVHRAHVSDGRVFLVQCEIAAPFDASSSRILGYVKGGLFEATRIGLPGSLQVSLRQLQIPGWSEFAAPAFCGRHAAFWSMTPSGELKGHVASLFDPRRVKTTSFGVVEVAASDMGWGVEPAAWSPACEVATFQWGAAEPRRIDVRKPR
jgi:hypothetical protein